MRLNYLAIIVLLGVGPAFAQSNASNENAPAPSLPSQDQKQNVEQNLKDVHFDFDSSDLRPQDRAALQSDAQWLNANPQVLITIEGNADERGDIVYNVVLSQGRATVTRDALVGMGVSPSRIAYATGWGKLYPVCQESDESCWQQNRSSHFAAW
jgi:peptidoglycan-associated lipoprotein